MTNPTLLAAGWQVEGEPDADGDCLWNHPRYTSYAFVELEVALELQASSGIHFTELRTIRGELQPVGSVGIKNNGICMLNGMMTEYHLFHPEHDDPAEQRAACPIRDSSIYRVDRIDGKVEIHGLVPVLTLPFTAEQVGAEMQQAIDQLVPSWADVAMYIRRRPVNYQFSLHTKHPGDVTAHPENVAAIAAMLGTFMNVPDLEFGIDINPTVLEYIDVTRPAHKVH